MKQGRLFPHLAQVVERLLVRERNLQFKWLKGIFVLLLLAAGVTFLSRGCEPQPRMYSFNGTTVFFPRQKPTRLFGSGDVPAAEYSGQLVLRDGCLRIEGDTSYALIWPPGYGLDLVGGTFQILDVGGRDVVQVGDEIYVGGGVSPVRGIPAIDEAMQQEVLNHCEEPYWFVGDVVRRVN